VAPGEQGELVCTVLENYAMPLIRYNLGDIAAGSPYPCACGRGLPLMRVVDGRTVDFVLRADGTSESPMQFLGKFDCVSEFALEYQVAQTACDEFRVTLVPRRRLCAGDRELIAGAILEQYPRAQVTVVEAADIPREPSGKRRTFRSEIAEQAGRESPMT